MKSMLPRRESERRTHSLARHCDILSAVETRISMLNMTFMKYIDSNVCCFIPGRVIDEIGRILTLLDSEKTPPRTHELLQELRDISSMAMEHFDEHILPNLRLKVDSRTMISIGALSPHKPKLILIENAVCDRMRKVKKQTNSNKNEIALLTQVTQRLARKLKLQAYRLKTQSAKLIEQERKIHEQSTKIHEQEACITDLKKHMDEWDQKFSDLTAEILHTQENLSLKAESLPSQKPSVFPNLVLPTFRQSNIKPRVAQISPKGYGVHYSDAGRKRKSNVSSEIPSKLSRNLPSVAMSNDIDDKIDANITSNISTKNINNIFGTTPRDRGSSKSIDTDDRGFMGCKSEFGSFLSSSLAAISSVKSRKRKMNGDISLN